MIKLQQYNHNINNNNNKIFIMHFINPEIQKIGSHLNNNNNKPEFPLNTILYYY